MVDAVFAGEGSIDRGAGMVEAARAEMTSELSVLRGRLQAVGTSWQGSARVAFDRLMLRWDDDATKLISALDEFEAQLRGTQASITSSDDAAQGAMTQLMGRLG
ncbi:MAG: WXG100 family type VII secretion target [Beutenbergiaceae bacterium]